MYSEGNIKEILPFFPHYTVELLFNDHLKIIWFESGFSQSRYNFENKNTGSNACTLIAVLMAIQCNVNNLGLKGPEEPINNYLIEALASSMLGGNKLYEKLKSKNVLSNINLTVPEAVSYAGKNSNIHEWKSMLYLEPLQNTLFENIKSQWIEWMHTPERNKTSTLYIVLIFDSRSVLLIMQEFYDTVTLIDSHQHTNVKGAVVAVVNRARLKYLCTWFADVITECYHSNPDMYELSFLYFRK